VIVVRVELHSAITRQVTEIARMHISNIGGTANIGDYITHVFRGRSKEDLDKLRVNKTGSVVGYPRLRLHIWNLVARALANMRYE
jgi:hypothetical protein